jgi:hypothetical protein
MSTKLQTALRTMTVWKRRVAGELVFKFQKPLGFLAHLYNIKRDHDRNSSSQPNSSNTTMA